MTKNNTVDWDAITKRRKERGEKYWFITGRGTEMPEFDEGVKAGKLEVLQELMDEVEKEKYTEDQGIDEEMAAYNHAINFTVELIQSKISKLADDASFEELK